MIKFWRQKKKKIFIQANCQGQSIKFLLNKYDRFKEQFEVLNIKPVHLWTKSDEVDIFSKINACDIFIHQPISENFKEFSSENLKEKLKRNCKIISFPVLYFTGYNPETFYFKNTDTDLMSFTNYHDANILQLYTEGKTIQEVYSILMDEQFYTNEYIEQNVRETLTELRFREKNLDIKIAEFIANNYKNKRLFWSMNHPTNDLIFLVVDQILEFLMVPKLTEQEKNLPNQLLGRTRLFIYPSLTKFLNFSVSEECLIELEAMKFQQTIEKYYEVYDANQSNVEANWKRLREEQHSSTNLFKNNFQIDQRLIKVFDQEIPSVFQKPENCKNHYIFHQEVFPKPQVEVYKFENAYITIDYRLNYSYKYYIYDSTKVLQTRFSYGDEPILMDEYKNVEYKKVAFIEDKFTKFNIAHLLLDKMTRIPYFNNDSIDAYILFSKNDYIEEAFEIADINGLYLIKDMQNPIVTYKIEELYVSTASFYHHRHPAQYMSEIATNFLRDFGICKQVESSSINKRIFIHRENAVSRRIENFFELKTLLEKYEFEIIELENLNLYEKRELFQNAEIVVGTYGAGLTHLIFCDAGTPIVELLPPLCATNTYYQLAQALGMQYYCLVCDDPDGIVPDYTIWAHEPAKYNRKNIIVDLNQFEEIVELLIGDQR